MPISDWFVAEYQELLKKTPEELKLLSADPSARSKIQSILDAHLAFTGRKKLAEETWANPNDGLEPSNTGSAYTKALRSRHWKELRKAALAVSGNKCSRCGVGEEQLHLHHKHYRTLGRESLDDVEVLCVPCHEMSHPTKKISRK